MFWRRNVKISGQEICRRFENIEADQVAASKKTWLAYLNEVREGSELIPVSIDGVGVVVDESLDYGQFVIV